MLFKLLRELSLLAISLVGFAAVIDGILAGNWWMAAALPIALLLAALDPFDIGKWRHIYDRDEPEHDRLLRESRTFMECGDDDGR